MRTQTAPPTRATVPLKTDVDRELAELVRDRAAADGRTTAGWIRFQLTKALANNNTAAKAMIPAESRPPADAHGPDDDRAATDRALTARRPAAQGG
jgi:hypothetical protein